MREILIINDLHLGVSRVAGATPQTALDLRLALLGQTHNLMMAHLDKHIVVNGDLFDAFDIPMGDALAFYETACDWLLKTSEPDHGLDPIQLILGRGNHDVSKDSSRLSMFDFIGRLLASRYPDRVRVVTEPTRLWDHVYMIPHCTNQDIFDQHLAQAEKMTRPCVIFLHANYDNKFTVEQDHSLGVSAEQARRLYKAGHFLIFGHEHQKKTATGVYITGNQTPSSVSDCLGNDVKQATVLHVAATGERTITEIETWRAEGSFARVDWREIPDEVDADFIRVEGEATAIEAAHMVQAISKLRQRSRAYVVTNAVKLEGVEAAGDLEKITEELTGVDVLNYLFKHMDERQVEVVKRLLAERQ